MKRKVIQIANSTQLISLPRQWAQKYGIKKGDELEVDEQGNKICISTEKTQDPGNIEVNITGLDRDSFMFLLRALYIRGYNEIKLVFNEPFAEHHRIGKKVSIISQIHEEANRLTGLEVIQQRENFCVLKVLTESSIKDFELIFRRLLLLLNDAGNDFINGAIKGDKYLLESMEEKHNTITKFMANSLRLLNKIGHPEYNKTQIYYHIIESIDKINDVLKDSARDVADSNLKISKPCEEVLQSVNDSLQNFSKLFYKFDFKMIEKISSDRYKVWKDIKQLTKKMGKEEIRLAISMGQIVETIYTLKVSRMALEY